MSYGHAIDPDRRFIFQVYEGHFSLNQVLACTRRLWTDPAYSKEFYGIVDMTRMTTESSIDDLHALIDFYRNAPQTSSVRWAAITSSPWLTAGSMLYKSAMTSRHAMEVFSTWNSARIYLQLDLTVPPAVTYFPDLAGPETPAVT